MNQGKLFESDFRSSLSSLGVFQFRPKDCPGAWPSKDPACNKCQALSVRFTVSNEFDLIVYQSGNLYCLELKSTGTTSMPFSSVRKNQLEGLKDAAQYEGVNAGIVVNFRKAERTFYIPIETLYLLMETSGKKSINVKDCEASGTEIEQTLKRTRYSYAVKEFLEGTAYYESG